jgi:hypothetical protein
LQMHLCERLGNPAKFVRVSEAVNGQPDPPVRSGIPAKTRPRACACVPADPFSTMRPCPFPKNFWLHAVAETGSGWR